MKVIMSIFCLIKTIGNYGFGLFFFEITVTSRKFNLRKAPPFSFLIISVFFFEFRFNK